MQEVVVVCPDADGQVLEQGGVAIESNPLLSTDWHGENHLKVWLFSKVIESSLVEHFPKTTVARGSLPRPV